MAIVRGFSCFLALSAGLTGCSGLGRSLPPASRAAAGTTVNFYSAQASLPSPIRHVVIIFQENRTADYMFQDVPGADVAKYAIDSRGKRVALLPVSLAAPYGLAHSRGAFLRDYDGGKMDGFDSRLPPGERLRPYGYGVRSEIRPYRDMAVQYVAADHMFQSNRGPSYPAHLYIVSGTATEPKIDDYRVSANPFDTRTKRPEGGGCDARPGTVVATAGLQRGGRGPALFPCLDRPVLPDLLDERHVSWRYYQHGRGPGLWHGLNSIRHVRFGPDFKNVVSPSETILTDIARGRLAGMSWVMPDPEHSDHAGSNSAAGPSWVAAVVNAIGKSQYWNNTAIFVTWDDWGGWYDHLPPPVDNACELGLRVPLIVISPYAKRGYVSKVQHEFGSLLAFTEETFGIPKGALGATDKRADDLSDAFDFTQKPRAFVPIKAPPFSPGPPNDQSEDP